MARFCISLSCILAAALFSGACHIYRDTPAQVAPPTPPPDALIAQGQARFRAFKCYECHGAHGEGTDDGPDLTGTHLNREEIALFLQKPSAHARSVGMPSFPTGGPDLEPLVAFVESLKKSR